MARKALMRLFFALWPPLSAAASLHAWAKSVGQGRVGRVETIHLTLAFLREVDDERLSILKTLRVKSARHSLPIEESRYWKHNQIVWVGPREIPERLSALASGLKAFLDENRFRTERRAFAAHVTLIRKSGNPGELPALPEVEWPVDEFVLVCSRLSGAGGSASYEVVHRYPLS
jgi:2'-5' RNA ligase